MFTQRNLTVAALVCGSFALPLAAQADDYRWEIGGNWDRLSGDIDLDDLDVWGVYGTYYFQDVKTDSVPLQEAAFLDRAGSVSLTPSRFDWGSDHVDEWRLSGEYYVPQYWLYLSAGVTRSDTLQVYFDGTNIERIRGHDTAWDATIGITPFAGLRVTTSFFEGVDYEPNLDVKYVGSFGDDRHYGLGLNLSDTDGDGDDLAATVSGDFYIDRTLRVGAQVGEEHWGVSADKFFAEKLSVGLRYIEDQSIAGGQILGLRAAWRF